MTALIASNLALVAIAVLAALSSAIAGRRRAAVRHLIWTSALVASIAALLAAFSGPRVSIPVTGWSQAPVGVARAPAPGVDMKSLIGVLWFAGVAVNLLRVAADYASARRLRRRAALLTDARWMDELARARAALDYRRMVGLRESAEIDVPLITGLRRPTLILPTSSAEWSVAERRSVLAHEVAHLANQDLVTRAIGVLACSLYWCNPLIWWLAARSEDEAEHAADALALRTGVRPSSYAAALVSLAQRMWHQPRPRLAVGFVRRASLSRRVHRVLALSTPHAAIRYPAGARLLVVAATCALAGWMGVVRFDARSATPRHAQVGAMSSADWTDDAVTGLTEVLQDPSPQVRGAAAGALARFARPESRAALEPMLADSNAFVRYEARRALATLPEKAP